MIGFAMVILPKTFSCGSFPRPDLSIPACRRNDKAGGAQSGRSESAPTARLWRAVIAVMTETKRRGRRGHGGTRPLARSRRAVGARRRRARGGRAGAAQAFELGPAEAPAQPFLRG